MSERGARPKVPRLQRRVLRAIESFTSPLLPADYLELVNPLWSTRELKGRIERVSPEAGGAVTVTIRPGWEWEGHEPGQYLRIGMEIDGKHHWRAYSLTSDPDRPDGHISITPKLVDEGVVSPYLTQQARPGTIVRLGGVEGTFKLADPAPERLLFISAGSGITPIASMLRHLARRDGLRDVVHVHSARTADQAIFGDELRALHERHDGYELQLRETGEQGRLDAAALRERVPDWAEREAYVCGPAGMLDAVEELWDAEGDPKRLHMERFQPMDGMGDGEHGEGGTITFSRSGVEATSDGDTPILVAGEDAGAELPFGCRMGICHTCVGQLRSGQVRDLRTGEVHGSQGETVRTCINAPEGAVEIEL